MLTFDQFHENWLRLQDRTAHACAMAGRDEGAVTILPVTKNHPPAAVEYAAKAGARAVGENRVQEAEFKKKEVDAPIQWELIGHLQSNKVRLAAHLFDRIQSVDSEKLIRKLQSAAAGRKQPLRVLLQVNAGEDPAKFGCRVEDAAPLLECLMQQDNLQVDGLMTIAPLGGDPTSVRRAFARLRTLRDTCSRHTGLPLPELSMGMTDDLEDAILEGSTQIRIGTALFGQRS